MVILTYNVLSIEDGGFYSYEVTTPIRGVIDLGGLNGGNGFKLEGVVENVGFGSRLVSNAGDVNGDGIADLIIGAPQAVNLNGDISGCSYVVFGKTSGFDADMDLSLMDGTNGFRLEGAAEGDSFGNSVGTAGDVNNDGFDDLIIGAPGTGPINAYLASGSSYIILGKASGFDATMNVSDLNGSDGFSLDGLQLGDNLGTSVSTAGDINGDGVDDLIIGAPYPSSSYIVFGKTTGFDATMSLSDFDGSNGFKLQGKDRLGISVSTAGDINGDGFDDVIVGTNSDTSKESVIGSSYVLFGKATGFDAVMDVSDVNGTNGFRLDGVQFDDYSGLSVSTAGDVNGDGFDDVIVGASKVELNGNPINGAAYVMFGKASGFEAAVNLSSLVDNNGLTLQGELGKSFTGSSVSTAGDVNSDGFDDLMISAEGTSYIVFGRSDFGGGELPTIPGTTGDDVLRGTAAAAAEQIDGGDGNDMLIGRGGADVFHGGAGVDQIKVPDLNFASIDGGTGTDILHLDGKDLHLDLASVGDKIQGIETICIYGRGDNTLSLTVDSVLNLSDTSNTLTLLGNAGDLVTIQDDGWIDGGVKGFYHTYANDDAVLLVGANLAIDFV